MEERVVPKLSEGDPLEPARRASVQKAVQVCLKALIYLFHLTVRLRVVSGAHTDLSARKGEKSIPKVAGEYPILIKDDSRGHNVKAVNVVHEKFSHG